MAKSAVKIPTLNMRIDKDLLMFLKYEAIKKGITLTTLVSKCLSDMKKRTERKDAPTDENI